MKLFKRINTCFHFILQEYYTMFIWECWQYSAQMQSISWLVSMALRQDSRSSLQSPFWCLISLSFKELVVGRLICSQHISWCLSLPHVQHYFIITGELLSELSENCWINPFTPMSVQDRIPPQLSNSQNLISNSTHCLP